MNIKKNTAIKGFIEQACLRKTKSPRMKKILIGLSLVVAGSSGYVLNEALWQAEIQKKEADFAQKELILRNEIAQLKTNMMPRPQIFKKYHESGVELELWNSVATQKFASNKRNPFEKLRLKGEAALYPDLKLDSLFKIKPEVAEVLHSFYQYDQKSKRRRNHLEKMFENGNDSAFFATATAELNRTRAALYVMDGRNGGKLHRMLNNDDSQLEAEMKRTTEMILLKDKHQMYLKYDAEGLVDGKATVRAFEEDADKAWFARDVLFYRRAAAMVNYRLDTLNVKLQEEIKSDSLAFESRKEAQLDSLVREAHSYKMPFQNTFGLQKTCVREF